MVAPAEESVLLIGEVGKMAGLVTELHACGFSVTRAVTLSEVVEVFVSPTWPSVVIVDVRNAPPWQVASMDRATELANAAGVPLVRLGGTPPAAPGRTVVLPAEAGAAVIAAAASSLRRAPYPPFEAPPPSRAESLAPRPEPST